MATDYTKRSRTFRSVRKADLARDLDSAFQSVEAEIDDTTSVSASDAIANLAQANWWIDPVAGLDTNTGITVGSPLKTWKEFERRTTVGPLPTRQTTSMTVTFLSSQPNNTDPVRPHFAPADNIYLHIKGTKTLVRSGTFTALSQTRTPASNLHWRLADSLVSDWTSDIGKQIKITSGAAANAYSYVWKNVGAGVAQFSSWFKDSGTPAAAPTLTDTSPVGNETYEVWSCPTIHLGVAPLSGANQAGTSNILFEDVVFGSGRFRSSSRFVYVLRCVFAAISGATNGVLVNIYNSMMTTGTLINAGSGSSVNIFGGLYLSQLAYGVGSSALLGNHVALGASLGIIFTGSYGAISTGGVAIETTGTGIQLNQMGSVRVQSGTAYIYGTSAYGVVVDTSSSFGFDNSGIADLWTLTGSTQDFSAGANLVLNVDIMDATVSPMLKVTLAQTLANFKAAAPAGMGYRCAPLLSRAYIGLR